MSKKGNTAVFMLVATVVNLLFILAFAFLGLFILVKLIPDTSTDQGIILPVALFALCFIMPVVLSMVLYSTLLKAVMKRFKLEDKLAPIFPGRRRRPRPGDDGGSPSVKG